MKGDMKLGIEGQAALKACDRLRAGLSFCAYSLAQFKFQRNSIKAQK